MSEPLGLLNFSPAGLGLGDGPTSARIAVVDWDADKGCLEPPVGWDAEKCGFFFRAGLEKVPLTTEHCGQPQFHQVNVWAVIQSVLEIYQATWVLGRAAPWAFEGNRLIVVPHAGYLDNAFYDRHSKSIQFYYFDGADRRVFTCLSHDIIAHETGHAILDGMRPLYNEDTSLETTAFHEFVADLSAIMTALLNNQVRWKVAQDTGGNLSRDRILSSLAEEFGWSATGRPYLRSAQKRRTLTDVSASTSPYDWSEVLTGAMFEILKGMASKFLHQGTGLLGPAPVGQGAGQGGSQPVEMALRRAADRFRRMALQPLDYLPPVDVQFADYCRAVLRADEIADPADKDRFRPLITKVFSSRSIEFAAETLPDRLRCVPDDIDWISRSRTDAYLFLNKYRTDLHIPAAQDISVTDLYQTDKSDVTRNRLPREIVLQYVWREDVELRGSDYCSLDGETAALLCGGTLVFDSRGNLLHWARKPGTGRQDRSGEQDREHGNQRRSDLLAYIKGRVARGQIGLVEGDGQGEIDTRQLIVARRAADGVLHFEVPSHLRNSRRE